MKAKAYVEQITIPTYELLEENINPTFAPYNGIYIYPYKLQDVISKEKRDKGYTAVILENAHVRCIILPELGGRLFSAENKKDGTQWFYKNHVIKPALIGTRGAWFSGGIEYNFPVGHNPNTYDRVNYFINESTGYSSVFFGNREAISNMDWTVELRIYDDKSYLEQRVSLQNENLVPNRYYFWTNTAVETASELEYIYPYDFAVSDTADGYIKWPGEGANPYNWDKNNKKPVEFFGKNINRPYFGTYDHSKERGVVHISNPRQLRGAKIFSWGWGNEAEVWRKVLTDDDSNYVEIQSGVFETQKVFELMDVLEDKEWDEKWFQIAKTQGFDNANHNGVIKLKNMNGRMEIAIYLTVNAVDAELVVFDGDQVLFSQVMDISCNETITVSTELDYEKRACYHAALRCFGSKENIIMYSAGENEKSDTFVDEVLNKDIIIKKDIAASGNVYSRACEYLKRDWPDKADELLDNGLQNDSQNLLLLRSVAKMKRNQFDEAEKLLTGLLSQNPFNDRARVYLGIMWLNKGLLERARDILLDIDINSSLYKHTNTLLAIIALNRKDYNSAYDILSIAKTENLMTLWLKTFCFRKLAAYSDSLPVIDKIQNRNPVYLKLYWEKYACSLELNRPADSEQSMKALISIAANDVKQYIDMSADYARIGAYEDALSILETCERICKQGSSMLYYHLADLYGKTNRLEEENDCLKKARACDITRYCPARPEEYVFLKKYAGFDGKEEYLLGNIEMKFKNYENALFFWHKSEELGFVHSTLFRNIAYYWINVKSDFRKALPYLEKGKSCGDCNIDTLLYLNSAYKKLGIEDPERKKSLLKWAQGFKHSFAKRCMVDLCCQLKEYEEAARILLTNTFDIWEHETDQDLKMENIYQKAFLGLLEKHLLLRNHDEIKMCTKHLLKYPDNVNIWFAGPEDLEKVRNTIRRLQDQYEYYDELL